jgi:hypothetical protein
MLLPMLAEWLCANNGKDERATRLVRDVHLFLVPTMNPDGFANRWRGNKCVRAGGCDSLRGATPAWREALLGVHVHGSRPFQHVLTPSPPLSPTPTPAPLETKGRRRPEPQLPRPLDQR